MEQIQILHSFYGLYKTSFLYEYKYFIYLETIDPCLSKYPESGNHLSAHFMAISIIKQTLRLYYCFSQIHTSFTETFMKQFLKTTLKTCLPKSSS